MRKRHTPMISVSCFARSAISYYTFETGWKVNGNGLKMTRNGTKRMKKKREGVRARKLE